MFDPFAKKRFANDRIASIKPIESLEYSNMLLPNKPFGLKAGMCKISFLEYGSSSPLLIVI